MLMLTIAKRFAITITASAFSPLQVLPALTDGSEGIVPENDIKIPANIKSIMNSNLDEAEFNAVIDKVTAIYAPIVSQMGGELNVVRNWDDGTVNAYASRRGGTWNVHMFGGLARHEAVTPDGFALLFVTNWPPHWRRS